MGFGKALSGAAQSVAKSGDDLASAAKTLMKNKSILSKMAGGVAGSAKAIAKNSAAVAQSSSAAAMNLSKSILKRAGTNLTDAATTLKKIPITDPATLKRLGAVAVVGGGAVYFLEDSYNSFNAKDGKVLTITKIEKGTTDESTGTNIVKITYTPSVALYKADTLIIAGNSSVPSINNTTDNPDYKINNIISGTVVELLVLDNTLTSIVNNGTLTLKTTYENQLALEASQAVDVIGDTAASAAGAAVGAAGDVIKKVGDSTGLTDFLEKIKFVAIGIAVLIVLLIIYKIYRFIFPKKTTSFGSRRYKFGIKKNIRR